MIAVVCVDDRNGLSFNRRRQSRDRLLIEDLLTLAEGRRLYCASYSAALFPEDCVTVCEDFFLRAGQDDLCFTELHSLPQPEKLHGLILYRWNRTYPADRWLETELSRFRLTETVDFPGSSHENLTREVYTL